MCKKDYILNLNACTCKNSKYSKDIIGDSVTTCDEIMKMTKAIPAKNVPTKVNEKRLLVKRKSSMFWLWRFLNDVYEL